MGILLFVAIFALSFSAMITALFCRIGPRLNLLDTPNIRSSHSIPTPRGGGIGILLAFLMTGLFFTKEYAFVLTCGAAGIVGFLSDLLKISSRVRLILYLLVSSVLAVFVIGAAGLSGSGLMILLALFFTIFLTGSANSYNFMDGINGIAGIMSVVSFGLLAAYFFREGGSLSPVTILAVAVIFSSIGFLRFNVPNARIFMGDVGSIFLGFTFAGIVILLSKNAQDFICLSSFLFIFYADETVTMCLRIKNGEDLLVPHRRHFYQILSNEGRMPHLMVSCGYGAAQLFIGISVLSLKASGIFAILLTLALYFAIFIFLNVLVRRRWELLKSSGMKIL